MNGNKVENFDPVNFDDEAKKFSIVMPLKSVERNSRYFVAKDCADLSRRQGVPGSAVRTDEISRVATQGMSHM